MISYCSKHFRIVHNNIIGKSEIKISKKKIIQSFYDVFRVVCADDDDDDDDEVSEISEMWFHTCRWDKLSPSTFIMIIPD